MAAVKTYCSRNKTKSNTVSGILQQKRKIKEHFLVLDGKFYVRLTHTSLQIINAFKFFYVLVFMCIETRSNTIPENKYLLEGLCSPSP